MVKRRPATAQPIVATHPIPGNTIPQNPVVLAMVAHRAGGRSRTIAPTIRCRTHGCPRPPFCNAAIVYPHSMRSAPSETSVFSNQAGSRLFLPRGALGARQPGAEPRPFREDRSVFRCQTRCRPLADKSHSLRRWAAFREASSSSSAVQGIGPVAFLGAVQRRDEKFVDHHKIPA